MTTADKQHSDPNYPNLDGRVERVGERVYVFSGDSSYAVIQQGSLDGKTLVAVKSFHTFNEDSTKCEKVSAFCGVLHSALPRYQMFF